MDHFPRDAQRLADSAPIALLLIDRHDLGKGMTAGPSQHRAGENVAERAGIFGEIGRNFRFIHAARGGVMISEYKETYYRERFLGAVRVLPDFVPAAPKDSIDLSYVEELVVAPDTLSLGPEDRRIVLLEGGGWAFVGPDGSLSVPEGEGALVLYADGKWRRIQPSSKRIPRLEEALAAPPARETDAAPDGAQYHTLKSGDTLSGLAKRYHTTVDKLCQLNGITRTTTLRVGKKIRVK